MFPWYGKFLRRKAEIVVEDVCQQAAILRAFFLSFFPFVFVFVCFFFNLSMLHFQIVEEDGSLLEIGMFILSI